MVPFLHSSVMGKQRRLVRLPGALRPSHRGAEGQDGDCGEAQGGSGGGAGGAGTGPVGEKADG